MKIRYSKDGTTFREIECDTNDIKYDGENLFIDNKVITCVVYVEINNSLMIK